MMSFSSLYGLSKKYKFLIRGVVSVVLLAFLFHLINWAQFAAAVSKANIYVIMLALGLNFFGVLFSTLRWGCILERLQIGMSTLKLFKLYLVGGFFNNFLPSVVGGDSYKFLILSRNLPSKRKEILSSIVFERGSGLLVVLVVNVFVAAAFFRFISDRQSLTILETIIFLVLIAVCLGFALKNVILSLAGKIGSRSKLYTKIVDFFTTLAGLADVPLVARTSIYSLLFVIASTLWFYAICYAFGIHVNPLYLLFFTTVLQIVSILPISLNSIGIYEGLGVFLLGTINISPDVALAILLTNRVLLLFTSIVGGLVYSLDNVNLSDPSLKI